MGAGVPWWEAELWASERLRGFSWSDTTTVTHLPFSRSCLISWKAVKRIQSSRGTENMAAFTVTSLFAMWGDRDD